MDFEVTADGKILAINDGSDVSPFMTDDYDNYMVDEDSGVLFKSYI